MKENKENTVRIKLKKEPLGQERIELEKKKRQKVVITLVCLFLFILGLLIGFFFANINKTEQAETYSKLDEIKNIFKSSWLYRDDYDNLDETLEQQAYTGMTTFSSDPYTTYMSNQEASDYYNNQINMSYVGIGVTYVPSTFVVTRVYKGSPAENAGIKAGDILISANGTKLEGKTSDEVKELVLGQEGTVINLEILRNNEIINIKAVRGSFEQTVYAQKLDDDIVLLEIMSFGINTGNECIEYLNDYTDCSKIIIDLRDNTGGYETAVQEVAGIFLGKDKVVMHKNYSVNKKDTDYTISNAYYDNFKDIVILTNSYTASASEVLTMALKEGHDNVTVVGTKTYGKGVMQSKYNLSDGSSIKLTVAYWTSPNNNSINGEGISPDIEIENHMALNYTSVAFDGGNDGYYCLDSVSTYTNIIQYCLDYLGYEVDRFDGYFDNSTLSSLNSYKQDYGLDVDGKLDSDTYRLIIAKVIEIKSTDLTKDIQLSKGREVLNG